MEERGEVIVIEWKGMALEVENPKATFYICSTIPKGFTSQDFYFKVLDAVNVRTIPGSIYGK